MTSHPFAIMSALVALMAFMCLTVPAGAADAALEGAWLQVDECGDVFVRNKGAVAFKRPANIFTSGFIIRGNRVTTPSASCTIKSAKRNGERRVLSLKCGTAVAVENVTAIFEPSARGDLIRYLSPDDTAGSTYKRCFAS